MDAELAALPDDVDTLKAALLAARAETAVALAEQSSNRALIAHLKLQIEKLNRDRFGPRSERTARLLDQMELQLEELEAAATEDELAAEAAAAKTTSVAGFARARPARRPFPEHLPRECIVVPGPVACACCGGTRLSKLGEDVTETLEVVPRQWKVIQHVREKFSCRDCECISQPPAPFHVTPRGWAGPNLLAMILFEKFGQHQPLNRQAERYAREGVPLSLSTLADQVGTCTTVLMPLFQRLQVHVMAAERLHGDDTTVPVLARGKTDIARLWTYVRDDRPFGGPAPPGAVFHYSRDRGGERTWEDLNRPDIRLAIELGSVHETAARSFAGKAEISGFKQGSETILALQGGKVDCLCIAGFQGLMAAKRNPALGGFYVLQEPVLTLPSCLGIRAEADGRWKKFVDAWAEYGRGTQQVRSWILGGLAENGLSAADIPPQITF